MMMMSDSDHGSADTVQIHWSFRGYLDNGLIALDLLEEKRLEGAPTPSSFSLFQRWAMVCRSYSDTLVPFTLIHSATKSIPLYLYRISLHHVSQ